ncbi:hypothetical protein [Pyrococcus kukulkanii]|uniref:Uncharacterized protein n=1 Tax=Pyrococcus kukulkanii TaxID=1609559 RepID=A0ABV4T7W7_9EURY
MSDVDEKIYEKVRFSVEEVLVNSYRSILIDEFAKEGRYKEILGILAMLYPGLGGYPKVLELECDWMKYCKVGSEKIIEWEMLERSVLQVLSNLKSNLVNEAKRRLDEIIATPDSLDEKIRARQIGSNIIKSIQESIEKILSEGKLAEISIGGYTRIDIRECIGKSAYRALAEAQKLRKHFEEEVKYNLKLLSRKARLCVLTLSAYPGIFDDSPFDIDDSLIRAILGIITQDNIDVGIEIGWYDVKYELAKAGLLIVGNYSLIPPFALEIWRTAPYNPEIIKDIPPKLVKRVRTILSWREENAGRDD